jgi:hypothetical protein
LDLRQAVRKIGEPFAGRPAAPHGQVRGNEGSVGVNSACGRVHLTRSSRSRRSRDRRGRDLARCSAARPRDAGCRADRDRSGPARHGPTTRGRRFSRRRNVQGRA